MNPQFYHSQKKANHLPTFWCRPIWFQLEFSNPIPLTLSFVRYLSHPRISEALRVKAWNNFSSVPSWNTSRQCHPLYLIDSDTINWRAQITFGLVMRFLRPPVTCCTTRSNIVLIICSHTKSITTSVPPLQWQITFQTPQNYTQNNKVEETEMLK